MEGRGGGGGKMGNGGRGDGGWVWNMGEVQGRDMGGKGGDRAGKVVDKRQG